MMFSSRASARGAPRQVRPPPSPRVARLRAARERRRARSRSSDPHRREPFLPARSPVAAHRRVRTTAGAFVTTSRARLSWTTTPRPGGAGVSSAAAFAAFARASSSARTGRSSPASPRRQALVHHVARRGSRTASTSRASDPPPVRRLRLRPSSPPPPPPPPPSSRRRPFAAGLGGPRAYGGAPRRRGRHRRLRPRGVHRRGLPRGDRERLVVPRILPALARAGRGARRADAARRGGAEGESRGRCSSSAGARRARTRGRASEATSYWQASRALDCVRAGRRSGSPRPPGVHGGARAGQSGERVVRDARFAERHRKAPRNLTVVGYERRERFEKRAQDGGSRPEERFTWAPPRRTRRGRWRARRVRWRCERRRRRTRRVRGGAGGEANAVRDPFNVGHPYGGRTRTWSRLFRHCGTETFAGKLPW